MHCVCEKLETAYACVVVHSNAFDVNSSAVLCLCMQAACSPRPRLPSPAVPNAHSLECHRRCHHQRLTNDRTIEARTEEHNNEVDDEERGTTSHFTSLRAAAASGHRIGHSLVVGGWWLAVGGWRLARSWSQHGNAPLHFCVLVRKPPSAGCGR